MAIVNSITITNNHSQQNDAHYYDKCKMVDFTFDNIEFEEKNTQILGFSYFLNILNWFQIQRHSRQIWIFILYKNNIYIQIDIEKTNVMCCDTMLRMLEFMLA